MGLQHPRTRLCSYVQSLSTTDDTSLVQPRIFDSSKDYYASTVCGRDAVKERHRSCERNNFSGVLLPRLPSHQEEREIQARHQPPSPESDDRSSDLQDGDCSFHLRGSIARGMGHLPGSDGRILPHPDSSLVQEVPSLRHQRQSLPVPCSSFRTGDGAESIHQDPSADGNASTLSGHRSTSIHRRHSGQSQVTRTTDFLVHRSHHDLDVDGLQD